MTGLWLLDQLRVEKPDLEPERALKSSLNWMRALCFEIEQEHGADPAAQYAACRVHLDQRCRRKATQTPPGRVFGPLFHSLTFAMSLGSFEYQEQQERFAPWSYQLAVMGWYYAHYFAVRSMLAANNHAVADQHRPVIRAFGSIHHVLPHPLNVEAQLAPGPSLSRKYDVRLPAYPDTPHYPWAALTDDFRGSREQAGIMLVQYMKGTADRDAEDVESNMRSDRKNPVTSFKTRAARDARNKRLEQHLYFMHCVWRYRGKANYRDSVFLAYGNEDIPPGSFGRDLAVSARFAFLAALSFIIVVNGPQNARTFLADARTHVRRVADAARPEAFWRDLGV